MLLLPFDVDTLSFAVTTQLLCHRSSIISNNLASQPFIFFYSRLREIGILLAYKWKSLREKTKWLQESYIDEKAQLLPLRRTPLVCSRRG